MSSGEAQPENGAFVDDFDGERDAHWARNTPGGGSIILADSVLRLALPGARRGAYSDAQIDDYSGRPPHFLWRPPLRLEVRARASLPAPSGDARSGGAGSQSTLLGTFGFGFWNHPLSLTGAVLRLPDAVWFFGASPPSNMALVSGMPGWGWKAQVVHAHRWGTLAATAPTAVSVLWARLSGREARAAAWVRRFSGTHEALITADMRDWHDYTLDWHADVARFSVDGAEVLTAPNPPRGPLGFVAWIDNQYAVATPRGALGFGTLQSGPEWLELDRVRIARL